MVAQMKLVLGFLFLVFGFFGLVGAAPTGPEFLNVTSNETWSGPNTGEIVNISGGYVSGMNVSATFQNPHWKAFVGWIDGEFTLDDSSGSSIYDWSLPTISGQVYATRNVSAVDWGNIGCASAGEILSEDVAMEHAGEDNISSTFDGTNSGTYVVAGTSIGVGSCFAANSYINNVSQSSNFEEFVLYDSASIVFATTVEDAVAGYDGADYDFQMIVPENGNESYMENTAYYLYVEIN